MIARSSSSRPVLLDRLLALGVVLWTLPVAAAEQVGRWDRFEVSVQNEREYRDPYRDVTLDVVFTRPDGEIVKFWGFHDGGTTWKLRCMPDRVGTWTYRAGFSDGSGETEGSFECVASELPGLISTYAPNPIWFGYRGGEAVLVRSFHLGDRFFAENWPAEQRAVFLDWAQKQGYNMLSIGSFLLNRGQPDRGGPWRTPDLWDDGQARPRPGEYAKMEAILDDLAQRGMMVFPFAGFFGQASNFPARPADQEVYLRYTLGRIGCYWNLTFNVSGPEPLVKPRLFQNAMGQDDVNRLGRLMTGLDPFGHLVSIHNGGGEDPFRQESWTGFITLQGLKNVNWRNINRGLLGNQTGTKPVYAHEVHWPGNYHNDEYSLEDIRRKGWVMLFSGATINFGDMDGNSSSGFTGTMDLDDRHQEWHDAIKIAWDGFQPLPWKRTRPDQTLVDRGFCLADAGKDYLVYLPDGGDVTVKTQPGTYRITWIRGGAPEERHDGGTVHGDGKLSTPDAADWVLHLERSR